MRRLALAVALLCATWSANAQDCGPLGRPLMSTSNTACPNTTIYASVNYAPPPYWSWSALSWSVVNGTINGPANTDYISVTTGTEPVTITLTATDGNGCSYTESRTIQVTEHVPIDIHSNSTVCPNSISTATAMGYYQFDSYSWSIENGEILQVNGSNVQFRAGSAGAVRLSVTGSGPWQSCSGSGTTDIPIAPPEGYIYYMQNMCTNTTQTVGGPSYWFDTYHWTIEGGELLGDPNGQYVTIQAGPTAGTITLTVDASSSASGCAVTYERTITVNDRPPAPQVTAPTAAVCNRALAEASVTNPSAYDYIYWDISGGSFENYQNVGSVVYFRPDVYWTDFVTLTAHGYSQGCETVTTVQVPVTPGAAPIIPGSQTICPGSSITLTAAEGASYSWSTGETTRSITVSAAGWYTATVTFANGCQATSSVSISHYSTTTPTVTASGPTTFCEGGSVTLTSSAASSYLWSNGATTQSITVSASGSYSVTTTNANGCSRTSAPTAVTVHPLPAPEITVGNSYTLRGPKTDSIGGLRETSTTLNYCGFVDINLIVSQPMSYTSFLWSTGATTPMIHVTSPGTYTVTVTNANGCSASDSVTVNVTPNPPAPTITASGSTDLCPNGSVTLTASAADSWLWSNGATTQSITVSEPGQYGVRATVNGCSSLPSSINVTQRSAAVTASGPTTFCEGGSVTLTATEGASYLWSNGATTRSIDVTASGSYSATVTFGDGCSIATAPVDVNAGSISVTISADTTTVCPNGSINVTSSVTGGPAASYQWHSSGGAIIPGATSPSLTLTPTTGGYVYLEVFDANGCSDTSNAVVYTVDEPSASITVMGATTFCAGGSTTLIANAGASYLWSNGATTPSITVTASGSYSVTVTTANGCSATSAATDITVHPTPATPAIIASGPTTFCAGGSVTLSAPAGFTYFWSTGATSQSINVGSSGAYSVTVTNASGCSATSAATNVTVNANPPVPVITASGPTTFCAGGLVTLSAPAGFAYLWSNGATSQSINVGSSGTYSVTVTNASGCSATSAATNVIVNANPPVPVITAGGSTAICPGSSVTLSAPAGYTYLWSNGSTAQSITVGAGNYSVTVRNASGCSATSATTTVTLKTTTSITQPANTSVPRNQQTTLSVTASGTNLTYRWYAGTTGNTSTPLGTASTQVVGPWTKKGTQSFWVRVTGDCGVVDSNTITVTVTN